MNANFHKKSSLKHVNIDQQIIGKIHVNWRKVGCTIVAIIIASIKCSLRTGSYALPPNKRNPNHSCTEESSDG